MHCDCNGMALSAAALKEKGIDVALLKPVLDTYAEVEGSLIAILQKAQDIYGYLPVGLLNYCLLYTSRCV